MNKINYYAEGEKIIAGLQGERAKLLLHCCCAPCASSCLEYLKEHFDVTVYFYNPNISGEEYLKRKNELLRLLSLTGWAKFLDCPHDGESFTAVAKGLESCPEGGERCKKCFNLRLTATARAAKENGFDYFATTLTLSPLKNAEVINKIGEKIAEDCGVLWLYSDFKKRGGYLRSIELSKKYGLYRQNYCGCDFSRRV